MATDRTTLEIVAPSHDVAQDIRNRYMEDVWEFERLNGAGEWLVVGDSYVHPREIFGEYPRAEVGTLDGSAAQSLSERQRLAVVGAGIIGGGLLLSRLD